MPKTPIIFMLLVILTLLATSQPSTAQDGTEGDCFELASRTYKSLNNALKTEHRAHFKKPSHRNSQKDLYKFRSNDFVGNPKTSLTEAIASIDTAIEQLKDAESKQCLSKEKVRVTRQKLSDAKKIDGFLHGKLTELGGSEVNMTAESYTTLLGKAIELKKAILQVLIASDFGGQ